MAIDQRHVWALCLTCVLALPAAVGAAEEPVTWTDLVGATVHATTLRQQVIRRNGREFPTKYQQDWKLTLGPEEQLTAVLTPTSHTPRGKRVGAARTMVVRLERPQEARVSGPGYSVWIFLDGTLTFLRTYKGGAGKLSIEFVRSANGITCTADYNLAREEGVGSIELDSPIDGAPVTVVSYKKLSSACRVEK